jgi:hypothetical protein
MRVAKVIGNLIQENNALNGKRRSPNRRWYGNLPWSRNFVTDNTLPG